MLQQMREDIFRELGYRGGLIMTTNQKLDFSREVRQWLGLGLSAASIGLTIIWMVKPDKVNEIIQKTLGGKR